MRSSKGRLLGFLAMGLAVSVLAAPEAEARRGGSIGSRGSRTHVAPPTTRTAPNQAAPVQKTQQQPQQPGAAQNQAPGAAANAAAKTGGMSGMAKGLIGGVIAGGLIAALMGGGLGALGGSGMLMALLQVALIGGLIWLALRFFRRKTAAAGHAPNTTAFSAPPFGGQNPASVTPQAAPAYNPAPATAAFGGIAQNAYADPVVTVTSADKETFERLLADVQDAFGREDYASLRAVTTAEVMSYLAEELSTNATSGWRNQVSETTLLEAEVAEAWREGDLDYATIAMRYESIDVMVDRTSGHVVSGDPKALTETRELWTFVRGVEGVWRLSAIQEAN